MQLFSLIAPSKKFLCLRYTLPMLLKIYRSFTYALSGLWHATRTERNLKMVMLFILGGFFLALILRITSWEWMILIIASGAVCSVELMNTSLERFADAFEHHAEKKNDPTHYHLMKATKDVAAAAALVSGSAASIAALIIFWPYVAVWIGYL